MQALVILHGLPIALVFASATLEQLLGSTTRIELDGPVVSTRMPEIGAVLLRFEF